MTVSFGLNPTATTTTHDGQCDEHLIEQQPADSATDRRQGQTGRDRWLGDLVAGGEHLLRRFCERLGERWVHEQALDDVGDLQVGGDGESDDADQLGGVTTDDRSTEHDAGRRIADDLDEAAEVVVDQRLRRGS